MAGRGMSYTAHTFAVAVLAIGLATLLNLVPLPAASSLFCQGWDCWGGALPGGATKVGEV
jgi:hypothetical protein